MFPRSVGDFTPEVFYLFELLDRGIDRVVELVRLGGWQVEGVLSSHEFVNALGQASAGCVVYSQIDP